MGGELSDQQQALPVQSGASIVVVTGDETREVAVDRVAEGLIWVSTADVGALQPGEDIELEIGVKGDARYRTAAHVAIAMRDFVGLRIIDTWVRRQGREYVRVSTYGVRAVITPADEEEPACLDALPVIDFSAGGARVAEEKHLEVGDTVKCQFPLGQQEFHLVARVVRVNRASAGSRRFVSLEFEGVSEPVRSDLISWVNQEQLRRRTQVRDRSQGSHGSSG